MSTATETTTATETMIALATETTTELATDTATETTATTAKATTTAEDNYVTVFLEYSVLLQHRSKRRAEDQLAEDNEREAMDNLVNGLVAEAELGTTNNTNATNPTVATADKNTNNQTVDTPVEEQEGIQMSGGVMSSATTATTPTLVLMANDTVTRQSSGMIYLKLVEASMEEDANSICEDHKGMLQGTKVLLNLVEP